MCAGACVRVRVPVCVRPKKTCRGVESGVIPALFKTTSHHGIRPGVWHWSPRPSLLYPGTLQRDYCFHHSDGNHRDFSVVRIYFGVKEGFYASGGSRSSRRNSGKLLDLRFWGSFCPCKLKLLLAGSNYGLWIVCGICGVLGS